MHTVRVGKVAFGEDDSVERFAERNVDADVILLALDLDVVDLGRVVVVSAGRQRPHLLRNDGGGERTCAGGGA